MLHPLITAALALFLAAAGFVQVSNAAYGYAAFTFAVALAGAISSYYAWRRRRA